MHRARASATGVWFAGVISRGNFPILALLARPLAGLMMLRRTRSVRFWSSVCMPTLLLVWMVEYDQATLASRIRLRMALVPVMISCVATRPEPS